MAVLCEYLDSEVGLGYNVDQRNVKEIQYTDASDLFLNGLIDRKQGTCASLPTLHVAIGWRLGWPVSLACVRSHYICRYDDGKVTYNIEATDTGRGGFSSRTDEEYIREYCLTAKAISTGSDLRAVTPREMLGIFAGCRARHMADTGNMREAEQDYLLARHLFPTNHQLYFKAMKTTVLQGARLFDPEDEGSPLNLGNWISWQFGVPKPPVWAQPTDERLDSNLFAGAFDLFPQEHYHDSRNEKPA